MKKITSALLMAVLLTIFMTSTVLAGFQGYEIGSTIWGGQNNWVGSARIWNDEDNLNVQVMMLGGEGWCLDEYHIHVGATLEDFPYNGGGNLKIGKFDYKAEFGSCLNGFMLEIPLADLEAKGIYPGDEFFMAIHIVAYNRITGQEETGWAVRCGDLWGQQFPGANWAGYIRFTSDAWFLFP